MIDDAATAEVARQVGYAIGDVLAKPLFGLLVLGIALAKSREEGYVEQGHGGPITDTVPDDASAFTEA